MADEEKPKSEETPVKPPKKTVEIVEDSSEELKRLQKKISGLEDVLKVAQERHAKLEEIVGKASKTPAPAETGSKGSVLDWIDSLIFSKPVKPAVLPSKNE